MKYWVGPWSVGLPAGNLDGFMVRTPFGSRQGEAGTPTFPAEWNRLGRSLALPKTKQVACRKHAPMLEPEERRKMSDLLARILHLIAHRDAPLSNEKVCTAE